MNTEDPWDKITERNRIRYEEKPPELVKFTKGEIAFWVVFFIAILSGITAGAIKAISMWLELP